MTPRRPDSPPREARKPIPAVLDTPKSHQSRGVPVPRLIAAELATAAMGKRADDMMFAVPGSVTDGAAMFKRLAALGYAHEPTAGYSAPDPDAVMPRSPPGLIPAQTLDRGHAPPADQPPAPALLP